MEWWTTTHDISYLKYGMTSLTSSTHKSTIKRGKQQNETLPQKPLVINLGKTRLHSEVNVVPQDETSKIADEKIVEKAQALDDSTNETDQEHH